MLNWIVWIRIAWLNWIAWNRNIFDNKTVLRFEHVLMLNWIVWNETVFDTETLYTLNCLILNYLDI